MSMFPENSAVVLVDIINDFDFSSGDKLLHNTEKIIPTLLELKSYARQLDIPFIYVNDHYGIWQSDFSKVSDYCRNEKNKEIINQMQPNEEDYFLIKPKNSGFFQTGLESLLHELKVENVILTGIAGDICVLFTANDAHMREFSLSVPENCTASNEEQSNQRVLHLMKKTLNANTDPFYAQD